MDFKKYIGMRWADIADMEDEENVFVDQNKIKNQQYDPFLDASSKDGFNLMLKKGLGLHSEDSMDSPKGVAKEPIKNPSTWKEDGRSFAQVVSANKTPVTTTMPFSSSTPQRVETTSTTSTNSLKRMHSSPSTKTSNKLLKTQEFGDKKKCKRSCSTENPCCRRRKRICFKIRSERKQPTTRKNRNYFNSNYYNANNANNSSRN